MINDTWETKEDIATIRERLMKDGKIHIPGVLRPEWMEKFFPIFTSGPKFWDILKEKFNTCNDWVYTLIDVYNNIKSEQDASSLKNFHVEFQSHYPEIYHATIVMGYDEEDSKSFMTTLKPKKNCYGCLSGLALDENDKSKMFMEAADRSSIGDMMANEVILKTKGKHDSHNWVVDILIESVCGTSSVRPHQHNKYPVCVNKDDARTMSKMKYLGDIKKMPKKMTINHDDLCCPPPGNGWSKKSLMEVIKVGHSYITKAVKGIPGFEKIQESTSDAEIYSHLNKHILLLKEYRILSAEQMAVTESVKTEYGAVKKAYALKTDKVLDKWQEEFITHASIGKSVLVQGPTSGGKTFVSMGVIDKLYKKYSDTSTILAFVAPNFYLSIQTYAVIYNTFKTNNISLVTKGIMDVPRFDKPGIKTIVGTPKEIWTLVRGAEDLANGKVIYNNKINIDILIIDEIHMLGNTDCSEMDRVAMANLMGYTTKQLIGLSATIHNEDLSILSKFMKDNSRIGDDPKIISYPKRPVPLHSHVYTSEGIEDILNAPEIIITPEKSKDLLVNLRSKGMTPTLVFEENDSECFNNFSSLISYLEYEDNTNFPAWNRAMELSGEITAFNFSSAKTVDAFSQIHNINKSSNSKLDKIASDVFKINKEKVYIVKNLVTSLRKLITEALSIDKVPEKYTRPVSPNSDEYRLLRDFKEIIDWKGVKEGKKINIDALQLLPMYGTYSKLMGNITIVTNICYMTVDLICAIPPISNSAPPHLVMGKTDGAQNIIDIIESKDVKENLKLRNAMIRMCKAERCSEQHVKSLFKWLAKGLKYGVGILIENTPYTVQLKVMALLKNRAIEIVFASQAMRMGIDYPIKCCVIRSKDLKDINTCAIMQMAGRAGRRGKDTDGHVVFWNVKNWQDATLDKLPRLILPQQDYSKGSYVTNPECVIKLISAMSIIDDLDSTIKGISSSILSLNSSNNDGSSNHKGFDPLQEDMEINFEAELDQIAKNEAFVETASNVKPIGSIKKEKPTLVTNRRARKSRKRFKTEAKETDKESQCDKDVGKFKKIIESIINIVANYRNKLDLSDPTMKSQVMRQIMKTTSMQKSMVSTIAGVSTEMTENKRENIKNMIDEWTSIVQELYVINRGIKNVKLLDTLTIFFETLHQTKYNLMVSV